MSSISNIRHLLKFDSEDAPTLLKPIIYFYELKFLTDLS